MLPSLVKIVPFVAALPCVLGHAVMTEPTPRKTGPVHQEKCGAAFVKALENDKAGPIEDAVEASAPSCDAYLCRGYQLEDNEDNALSLAVGDVVTFHIDLIAGHNPGYANLSIVNPSTNTIVGDPLVVWGEGQWPDMIAPYNDTDFEATIPEIAKESCAAVGDCVIQWFWYAMKNEQTYESCVDFSVA